MSLKITLTEKQALFLLNAARDKRDEMVEDHYDYPAEKEEEFNKEEENIKEVSHLVSRLAYIMRRNNIL